MEDLKIKRLSEIPGLEGFIHYGVDVDGNVYSWKSKKIKKLSPGWAKKKDGYLFVRISDNRGVFRNFLVHRLIAMAFIPCNNFLLEVNHRNKNPQDNRIENLEWKEPKIDKNIKGFVLKSNLLSKTKEVYSASIRKGIRVPDGHSFMNNMFEEALNSYIAQYGLRKILNQSN